MLTEYIPSKSSSNASTTNVEKESEQEETNGSSHDPDVPMADDTETRDGDAEGFTNILSSILSSSQHFDFFKNLRNNLNKFWGIFSFS